MTTRPIHEKATPCRHHCQVIATAPAHDLPVLHAAARQIRCRVVSGPAAVTVVFALVGARGSWQKSLDAVAAARAGAVRRSAYLFYSMALPDLAQLFRHALHQLVGGCAGARLTGAATDPADPEQPARSTDRPLGCWGALYTQTCDL